MSMDQNTLLQQISQGNIKSSISTNTNNYLEVAPKMLNKYLRALVNDFRSKNKLSDTDILDGILLLDEKIENKEVLNKDIKEIKI